MSEQWQPWPDLQTMWDRAVKEGLWFFSRYQQIWMSPEFIRRSWNKGQFRWGAVNWELRDPKEHLKELEQQAAKAQAERILFRREIEPDGGTAA